MFDSLYCTPEHPILTLSGWKESKDITEDDYVAIPLIKDNVRDLLIENYEKDKDFLWVLGMYLAEGSLENDRVTFTLNIDETEYSKKIYDTLTKYGASVNISTNPTHHRMDVRVSGKRWVEIFFESGNKYCFGKKLNKRFMFIDPKLQLEIFRGWADGDGGIMKKRLSVTTTSEELAFQMYHILIRNNIRGSLTRRTPDEKLRVYILSVQMDNDGIIVRQEEEEDETGKNYRGFFKDSFYYSRVNGIEKEVGYTGGKVYNLEVEDDNSYIVNSVSVHNCAAQTAACMKEWQEKRDMGIFQYFSPMFVYNLRPNKPGYGMFPRDVMKILQDNGDCLDDTLPYGNDRTPTQTDSEQAKMYKIQNYAQVTTVDGLKQALFTQGPCFIALPVYSFSTTMWKQENNAPLQGGHACTIVGYDNNKEVNGTQGAFLLRNSWSASWGDKGYCWFPYADWNLKWECWTTIDADSGTPKKIQWWLNIWWKIKGFINRGSNKALFILGSTAIVIIVLVVKFGT
jgi:hypothetical protein